MNKITTNYKVFGKKSEPQNLLKGERGNDKFSYQPYSSASILTVQTVYV